MKYFIFFTLFISAYSFADQPLFDQSLANGKVSSYCKNAGTCAGMSWVYGKLYEAQLQGKIKFEGGSNSGKWNPPTSIHQAKELLQKAMNVLE